jgi:hypothetical protein
MTWTHAQCETCWTAAHPEGRTPVTVRDAKPEPCCFCGTATTAGIYIRHDPRVLSCNHPEADR